MAPDIKATAANAPRELVASNFMLSSEGLLSF
jgi:hypothetical protein